MMWPPEAVANSTAHCTEPRVSKCKFTSPRASEGTIHGRIVDCSACAEAADFCSDDAGPAAVIAAGVGTVRSATPSATTMQQLAIGEIWATASVATCALGGSLNRARDRSYRCPVGCLIPSLSRNIEELLACLQPHCQELWSNLGVNAGSVRVANEKARYLSLWRYRPSLDADARCDNSAGPKSCILPST